MEDREILALETDSNMLRLLLRRLALGTLTLFLVSVLIFVGTEILPGDAATSMLGQNRTPEAVAALREQLGLNRPAPLRYVEWLYHVGKGDAGFSLAARRDMGPEIRERLSNTLFLAGVVAVVSVPLSVMLGLACAIWQNGWFDRLANILALLAVAVPEFFLAYVLIIVLSVQLGWFPSLALLSDDMTIWDRLYAVTLPTGTLTLVILAHIMRTTRTAVIQVLTLPYIEMAVLKGMPQWRIVVRHSLPNAAAPIINAVAQNLAYLIVGVVVVEVVFSYPGLGQLMVDSVAKRDLPVAQTCGLFFSGAYVLLNLVADILIIVSNPRLRHPH